MLNWTNQHFRTKVQLLNALKNAMATSHQCPQNIGGQSYCMNCCWINPHPQAFLPHRFITLHQQVQHIITALESPQGDAIFAFTQMGKYVLTLDLYKNGVLCQMSNSLVWSTRSRIIQGLWYMFMKLRYFKF